MPYKKTSPVKINPIIAKNVKFKGFEMVKQKCLGFMTTDTIFCHIIRRLLILCDCFQKLQFIRF